MLDLLAAIFRLGLWSALVKSLAVKSESRCMYVATPFWHSSSSGILDEVEVCLLLFEEKEKAAERVGMNHHHQPLFDRCGIHPD